MRTFFATLGLSLLAGTMVPASYAQTQPAAAPTAPTPTSTSAASQRDNYDPLLDLPPLHPGKATLVGGTITNLDQVMNKMVVQPFGGKQKMRVRFDMRTRFYRDGAPIAQKELKEGERIYLDTILNGDRVFAKTVWIRSSAGSGVGRGQITELDQEHRTVTIRDEISNQPVKLQMGPSTSIRHGEQPGTVSDLKEGALVSIAFGAQKDLREITVLATPGSVFTFAGRVTYLDMSRKLIAVDNKSDGKNYDIYLDAVATNVVRQIREGANVNVSAVFDGSRYSARQIDVPSASTPENR